MAIAAFHRSFEDLMMKRFAELRLGLSMAADAQLRFALLEKSNGGDARILNSGLADLRYRIRHIVLEGAV